MTNEPVLRLWEVFLTVRIKPHSDCNARCFQSEGRQYMDVYECIRTRQTVREFKPDPVPDAIVHKILRAGRWAPSSSNTQPWHFVVVRERETIAAIGRIATQGAFIGQAPLAIAIVMENARRPQLDAGRALQQMGHNALWADFGHIPLTSGTSSLCG